MEKSNRRNQFGIKNSSDMYRTINGIEYTHYTSDTSLLEELRKEIPEYKFIKRNGEIFKSVNLIN